jgi:hypothetical protein
MTFEIFRCRSCYHKPRPGCAMCAYWVDFQERHAERVAVAHQCACGFVSNVPRLVLEHDAGTCAPWPKDGQR